VVVPGGATRQLSVDAGLRALADDIDTVLVHDVARPFVPTQVIDRVLDALGNGADAAIPALPVTDTIKQVDADGTVVATVDRDRLVAVQTPQGFRLGALVAAHEAAPDAAASDDALLVESLGGRVVVVAGDDDAFKITTPRDLLLAEAVAARG
jgi:2-C-methyl-D-erythritol 4-phosphate cytidylyltransferase